MKPNSELTDVELSAKVAIVVMRASGKNIVGDVFHCPAYSTDISTAFECVAAMAKKEFWLNLHWYEIDGEWGAYFFRFDRHEEKFSQTPARAICQASLAALEEK